MSKRPHFLIIIGWPEILYLYFMLTLQPPPIQVEGSPLLKHFALFKHLNAYTDFRALLAQYVDLSPLDPELIPCSQTY